jgi:hypothetical protein
MRTLHVFIVASLAGTMLACGQKGPLLLPDAQHPHKKIGIGKRPAPPASAPPSAAPAPASPAPTGPASTPNAAPTDATAPGEAQTRPTPAPQP